MPDALVSAGTPGPDSNPPPASLGGPAQPLPAVLAPLADPAGHRLAAASLRAEQDLPARRTVSSSELGWRSILVRAYDDPEQADPFTTAPTPDLLLVVTLTGTFTMECRRPHGWVGAPYRPGAIGATAPGGSATLRWRSVGSSGPRTSVHLHLSSGLLRDTAAALGSESLLTQLPDSLLLEDPFILATGRALLSAVKQGADALFADSMAQALAMHLLYGRLSATDAPRRPADPGALTGAALRRVVDHMHEHLAEDVALDDLAKVANVSKFHFLRLFSQATGVTPHRYLVRLRMERAGELMRDSAYTVSETSAECGYASPGQFACAFRRHHGATPTQYRRDARR